MTRQRLLLTFITLSLTIAATALAKKPGGDGTYTVTISGDLSAPGSYEATAGGGRSKPIQVQDFIDLDLRFFFDKFGGEDNQDGKRCFEGAPTPSRWTPLLISQERDGTAFAGYWFNAFGVDGATPIRYQLEVFGEFIGPWRPGEGQTTNLVLTHWWMKIEGKKNKNLACRELGLFTNQTIAVTGAAGAGPIQATAAGTEGAVLIRGIFSNHEYDGGRYAGRSTILVSPSGNYSLNAHGLLVAGSPVAETRRWRTRGIGCDGFCEWRYSQGGAFQLGCHCAN